MTQNVVIKGRDNPVIVNFAFTGDFAALGLNTCTRIDVGIGGETYSTSNPANVSVENSGRELHIKIGDTTQLEAGAYMLDIVGFSATYNDGYVLSGLEKPRLGYVYVVG